MSTPNFSCKHNARHLYAFCDSSDYETYKADFIANNYDEDEEVPDNIDEWLSQDWYRSEKEYYLERLTEKLNEKFGKDNVRIDDTDPKDGDSFATIYTDFTFANYRFDVELTINLEAGYYEGFALDWNIKQCEYIDALPDAEDCFDLLYYNANKGEGLSRMLCGKLAKKFAKVVEDLGNDISDCLEAVAPYVLEGSALCNGEGIYWNARKTA